MSITLENALSVKEQMISVYDKKLFIVLYGDLISPKFKEELESRYDIATAFDILVNELENKRSSIK